MIKSQRTLIVDLVGGLEHVLFFHILGIIIPTDELIFFRWVGIPPTSDSCVHSEFQAFSQCPKIRKNFLKTAEDPSSEGRPL